MIDPDLNSGCDELCAEAEAAMAAGDLAAAAFAYGAALGMLPPAGAELRQYALRLARAGCLHGAGAYDAEAEELDRLAILADQLGDPTRRVTVALRRANLLIAGGDAASARLIAAAALTEARASGDAAFEAESLFTLARAAYVLNDLSMASARANQALGTYIALGDRRGEAHARRILGMALHSAGGEAMGQLRVALDLCRAIGDRAGEAMILDAIGVSTRDRAEARAVYLQGLAIAESSGDRESEASLANNLSTVYLSLGLYRQARAQALRAVRLARALGARELLATFLTSLGRAYAGMGQLEHARVALSEANALAESSGNPATMAITLICLGMVELAEERPDEAGTTLDEAIALYDPADAGNYKATALAWRAAAHLMLGETADADTASAQAIALIAHEGGPFPAHEIWWQRYRALLANQPCAEAGEALARARDSMYAAVTRLSDTGLRRSYLGRVEVNRAIVEALAERADEGALTMPAPPPLSHASLHDQLTRLLGVTARLNELRDAAALREMFLDELVELCGAERVLLLLGPCPDAPEALIARGMPPEAATALHTEVAPMLREALRRRRALSFDGPGDGGPAEAPALRRRSAIAVPLISGARTVGAFYADVRAFFGPFGASDLDLISLLAAQAATALENARLYAQTLRAKEELEQLVTARTADLQAANQALAAIAAEAQAARAAAEAASSAKSAFLANVSHELRTPLNAVIGFAQVLQRDQGLSERQRELLQIIGHSGDHLLRLINDVLELSKIEAGRLEISPAPFDLHTMLSELAGLFRLRADARQLELAVQIAPGVPRYVIGDEDRLRQILINLVGNALKFTNEGGVRIEADARAEGTHLRLRLVVSDTGIGIRPPELELLFRPFVQTESGRRLQEGTGLGLALSRQLARLMGGDISAASTPGSGTTFVVEILVDPAAAPLEKPQTRPVAGLVTAGRRYRALVAAEHWQTRRLLAEWLHEAGIEVREAADGGQALATWDDWHPHLALLDTRLALIDGIEAARRINESPHGRATVVILVAGSDDDQRTLAGSGGEAVLHRPVGHDELLTCVAQHLGLELRYAEPATQRQDAPLVRADLQELPSSVRAQLAAAAATSDPAAVAAAIARVSAGWPGLGQRLGALAEEFAYETIELLASDG